MKSPYLGEEHEMLRDQLRRFVREEVEPHGEDWEKEGHVPKEGDEAVEKDGITGRAI